MHRGWIGKLDRSWWNLDAWVRGLCLTPLVLVPGLFHRSTFSVFTTPKVTVVWLVACLLLAAEIGRLLTTGRVRRLDTEVEFVIGFMLVALLTVAVLSPHRHLAWWGVGVRWSGALSYLALLILTWASAISFDRGRAWSAGLWGSLGAVPVVAYTLVQVSGRDPFDWAASQSFGTHVMSTFGNPNFSSAFLAIITPLVLACALRQKFHWIIRGSGVFLSVVMLGCIGHLVSLQGQIAVLTSVLVLGIFVAEHRQRLVATLLLVGPLALVVAVIPLAAERLGISGLLLVAGVLAVSSSWVGRFVNKTAGDSDKAGSAKASPWSWATAAVLAIAGLFVFVAVFSQRLGDELGERWDFWSVALKVFSDRPVTGLGLETFGTRFGELRGADHVVDGAAFLSDSPHSVPIGLLAGGGVLIATAYAALTVTAGWVGIRLLRRCKGDERLIAGGIVASWLAYHLQSLVSVDIPALGVTNAVLTGMLFAMGARTANRDRTMIGARVWRHRPLAVRRTVGVAAAVLVAVILVEPALGPLRADRARHQAMISFVTADYEAAEKHIRHGIELRPDDGMLWQQLGQIQMATGQFEEAYRSSAYSAELRPGDPTMALQAARNSVRLVARPGYLNLAAKWYETAAAADPHGSYRSEAAAFFEATGALTRANELRNWFDDPPIGTDDGPQPETEGS